MKRYLVPIDTDSNNFLFLQFRSQKCLDKGISYGGQSMVGQWSPKPSIFVRVEVSVPFLGVGKISLGKEVIQPTMVFVHQFPVKTRYPLGKCYQLAHDGSRRNKGNHWLLRMQVKVGIWQGLASWTKPDDCKSSTHAGKHRRFDPSPCHHFLWWRSMDEFIRQFESVEGSWSAWRR